MSFESGWASRAAFAGFTLLLACTSPSGPPFEEGERRCGSVDDCPPSFPACRCDGRCHATDDGEGRRDDGPSPSTVTFLLTALRIAATERPGPTFGLDLDGEVDGRSGCTAARDRVSLRTGARGVDDQAQQLLSDIEAARSRSIARANLDTRLLAARAWSIEVRRIDDFEDDCDVEVELTLIQPVRESFGLGADCNVHAAPDACEEDVTHGCLWSTDEGRCLGLALAQEARVQVSVGTARGRIAAGVLHTEPIGEMQLELTYEGEGSFAAQLIDTRIEADITPTSLSGELGARIEANNLLGLHSSARGRFGGFPDPERARSDLAPDLMPDERGECTHASAGFAFSAIPYVQVP